MFNNFNNRYHPRLQRNESSSTVSSSVAAEDIRQQIEDLRNVSVRPKNQINDSANIKFENIEKVNIVYHNNYCNHSSSKGNLDYFDIC